MVGFAGVLRQVGFRILTCMLLSVQYPYVVTADLANSLDPNRRKLQKKERKKTIKNSMLSLWENVNKEKKTMRPSTRGHHNPVQTEGHW